MKYVTRKRLKVVAIVALALVLAAGIVASGFAIAEVAIEGKYEFLSYDGSKGGDRIHFLNTGSSDAILLESAGKFALIDCGEDSDNPRGFDGLELQGYEDFVVRYLNEFCADDNGIVNLDFILGTHAHSDHLGGFDTVIEEDNVRIGRAYLKPYYEDRIDDYEVENWDNLEVYEQTVNALNAKGVPVIQDLEGLSFTFGNYTVTVYNGKEAEEGKKVGENENSLAVLIEKDGYRVMLSGDMNNYDGDEDEVGAAVGKVNVLKLGHHGYRGSSSADYVRALSPDFAIQTTGNPVDLGVKLRVTFGEGAPIYSTVKHNGIILDVTRVDAPVLYQDIL